MRKNLIALLGFLSGAMVYYINEPARNTASVEYEEDHFHQQEFVSTSQAAPSNEKPAAVIPVETNDTDPSEEVKRNVPGLPRGMQLAPQVRAVPLENYQEALGKILMKKNGFAFFRSESTSAGNANVVYDQRLNTFHPLTATIKIANVNESQREENLRKWSEYHYNGDLEIQYVQSSHQDLLEDYEELKKSGAKVSLEVIQAVFQSR